MALEHGTKFAALEQIFEEEEIYLGGEPIVVAAV